MDLDPAPWRGKPGSTLQAWEFFAQTGIRSAAMGMTERILPDRLDNRYAAGPDSVHATGFGLYFPRGDWLPLFAGRDGVWRFEKHPEHLDPMMLFTVPNCDDPKHAKEVWVQMTYRNVSGHPVAELSIPPRGFGPGHEIPYTMVSDSGMKTHKAGMGWTHRRITYGLDYCPSEEAFWVRPPGNGVLYLDEVIIETLCRRPQGVRKAGRRRRA
jgi:hypothetical protein